MRLNFLCFLLVSFLFTTNINAQSEPSFKDKITYGGTFWLDFWSSNLSLEVSPVVGYRVKPNWTVGCGVVYQYSENNASSVNTSLTNYGWRLLTIYYPLEFLNLQAELEGLTTKMKASGFPDQNIDRPLNLFLGAGYRMSVGKKGGVFFSVLYNVLYEERNNAYTSPISTRIGVMF